MEWGAQNGAICTRCTVGGSVQHERCSAGTTGTDGRSAEGAQAPLALHSHSTRCIVRCSIRRTYYRAGQTYLYSSSSTIRWAIEHDKDES